MTRDEAIAKIEPIIANAFPQVPLHRVPALAASEVDMFVALGVLKLDEPKAPYEILAAELGWADTNTRHLKATLDRCGLRVVRA